jgi:hypothetical protein
MAETTTTNREAGLRARQPTADEVDDAAGHKWEPRTPEQDERLATPTSPAPPAPKPGKGAEWG